MITKEEAQEILAKARDEGPLLAEDDRTKMFVGTYLLADDYARELAEEISAAAGEEIAPRALAWGTMIYACSGTTERRPLSVAMIQGGIDGGHITQEDAPRYREHVPAKPPCGWEHRVWLGLGCEGPKRDEDEPAYIPVPFVCGTCPNCETGALQHDRWNEDQEFGPRPFPEDAPRFVLPERDEWERLAVKGYGGADYLDPSGATTPGR